MQVSCLFFCNQIQCMQLLHSQCRFSDQLCNCHVVTRFSDIVWRHVQEASIDTCCLRLSPPVAWHSSSPPYMAAVLPGSSSQTWWQSHLLQGKYKGVGDRLVTYLVTSGSVQLFFEDEKGVSHAIVGEGWPTVPQIPSGREGGMEEGRVVVGMMVCNGWTGG